MNIEQTLSIYYEGKAVAEKVKLEGTDWLKGVSWVDAIGCMVYESSRISEQIWWLKSFVVSRETPIL